MYTLHLDSKPPMEKGSRIAYIQIVDLPIEVFLPQHG